MYKYNETTMIESIDSLKSIVSYISSQSSISILNQSYSNHPFGNAMKDLKNILANIKTNCSSIQTFCQDLKNDLSSLEKVLTNNGVAGTTTPSATVAMSAYASSIKEAGESNFKTYIFAKEKPFKIDAIKHEAQKVYLRFVASGGNPTKFFKSIWQPLLGTYYIDGKDCGPDIAPKTNSDVVDAITRADPLPDSGTTTKEELEPVDEKVYAGEDIKPPEEKTIDNVKKTEKTIDDSKAKTKDVETPVPPKTVNANPTNGIIYRGSNNNIMDCSEPVTVVNGYTNLSEADVERLAHIAYNEQGTISGFKVELTQMCNLYKTSSKYSSVIDCVENSTWYSKDSRTNTPDSDYYSNEDEYIKIAKDVLLNGYRYAPENVVEHDDLDHIKTVCNNGVYFDKYDRSQYIPGVTVIVNCDTYGNSRYIFDGFADNKADPFGHFE